MWKVSGIKSDLTAGRYYFFAGGHEKMRKTPFLLNESVNENFQSENFWDGNMGMGNMGTATDLAFRISI